MKKVNKIIVILLLFFSIVFIISLLNNSYGKENRIEYNAIKELSDNNNDNNITKDIIDSILVIAQILFVIALFIGVSYVFIKYFNATIKLNKMEKEFKKNHLENFEIEEEYKKINEEKKKYEKLKNNVIKLLIIIFVVFVLSGALDRRKYLVTNINDLM